MNLRILEEAQQDLEASLDYYNGESPGLGYDLLMSFTAHLTGFTKTRMHGHRFPNERGGA
jgi:hypothetical protein